MKTHELISGSDFKDLNARHLDSGGAALLPSSLRSIRGSISLLLKLSILWLLAGPVWAQKGTGFSLRVVNEIAPPGGLALVRVELTEPKPISGGKIRLSVAASQAPAVAAAATAGPLGAILAAGMMSRSGDVRGLPSITANAVTIDFTSPGSTLGLDLDLPLMVVAIAVSPDAVPGSTVPLTLDLSASSFLDSTGQPYVPEAKQGSFTVGGVSVTKLIASSQPLAPGSTITLQGVGFQPGMTVALENASSSSMEFVSSRQINLTLGSAFNLDASSIRLRNPDGSDDVFYALPELTQIGSGTGPKPNFALSSLVLPDNSSEDLLINLSPAAQSAGTLTLTSTSAGILQFPASLPVSAGASSVTLRVFGQNAGNTVLTAAFGGSTAAIPVHVISGSSLQIPVLRNDATMQLGLALTNTGTAAADILVRGFANDPSSAALPASVSVAVRISLAPGQQVSKFLSQYDPRFEGFKGWVEVRSPQPGVRAMFLNLPSGQLEFAGSSDSIGSPDLILPQTHENSSGDFEFVLVNNSSADASVQLEWWDGGRASLLASRVIPIQASLASSLLQVFPGVAGAAANGFMRVRSSQPLTAYQQEFAGGVLTGRTPPSAGEGSTRLLLPQFAAGAGWYTEIVLVNPRTVPSDVSLNLLDDRGVSMANPVRMTLPAGGQTILQGKDLFGLTGSSLVVGSLSIDSQSEIVGTAIIGDDGGRFASSVPVLSRTFSEAAFAQVATGTLGTIGYFTGLALENPNASPANVTIEIFTDQGLLSGQCPISIPAGGRLSKLLSELIPGLPPQLGGHVHVISSIPIGMLEIFGDDSLDFITTVPAAVVR